jgi:glycosyltransferase involved in cell wall biosynthesis
MAFKITVLAPAHNEKDNLELFITKVKKSVKPLTRDYEIIIVDDGSTDGTFDLLKKLKASTPQLKAIKLRRKSGQTAGLMAGVNHSTGDIIVMFDADLQQDPADISKLVEPIIKKKADVASGRRTKKKHSLVVKFISAFGHILRKKLLNIDIQDTAVSPNAYKKEALVNLDLYGEMHRFLVPILHWRGFKVLEVDVSHHKRHAGKSKYKPTKAIRGFLDLIIVKFWQDYSARPIHVFGTIGLVLMAIGLSLGLEEAIRKIIFHQSIINRTVPLFATFMVMLGTQFLVFGILADILIRIYYKDKPNYYIEETIK